MTALLLVPDFPIEILYGAAQISHRLALLHQARALRRQFLKERVMSLVTYGRPIIRLRLRDFLVSARRWFTRVFEAIAEARVHRAMIEAQLYLNRCKHASKNDDDLPVLR